MFRSFPPVGPAVLAALLLTAPVRAQESPLAQVPATAPVVIALGGPKATADKAVALVKKALPDFGPLAEMGIKGVLQGGIPDRNLTTLIDGPLYLVLTEAPKADELANVHLAVVARVKDYEAFKKGFLTKEERESLQTDKKGHDRVVLFDQEVYLAYRKETGYLIATNREEVATALLKGGKGLDTVLSKEAAARFAGADVGLYFNGASLMETYGDLLNVLPPLPDPKQQEQLEAFVTGLKDLKAGVITATVAADGAGLGFHLEFKPDSKTGKAVQAEAPAALGELTKLPAGLLGYTQSAAVPKGFLEPFGTGNVQVEKLPKEVRDQLNELATAAGVEKVALAGSLDRGIGVWQCKAPGKLVEASKRYLEARQKAGDAKDRPTLGKGQKYRGQDVQQVTLTMNLEVDPAALQQPGAEAMLEVVKKKLGDRQTLWYGAEGNAFFTVRAKDWETAQGLLDAHFDGKGTVGEDPAFGEARKLLPAQASVLILAHAGKVADVGLDFVEALAESFGGDKGVVKRVPKPAKVENAYFGFGVVTGANQVTLDVVITSATIREFRRALGPTFQGLKDQ